MIIIKLKHDSIEVVHFLPAILFVNMVRICVCFELVEKDFVLKRSIAV